MRSNQPKTILCPAAAEYERQIALVLDRQADVLWWYRNKVGAGNFMVQGYKKNKIYPDFVVRQRDTGQHHVLVLEGKGKHLEGNPDTTYKRAVAFVTLILKRLLDLFGYLARSL